MSITFEGYEKRIDKINACLKKYGIAVLKRRVKCALTRVSIPTKSLRGLSP